MRRRERGSKKDESDLPKLQCSSAHLSADDREQQDVGFPRPSSSAQSSITASPARERYGAQCGGGDIKAPCPQLPTAGQRRRGQLAPRASTSLAAAWGKRWHPAPLIPSSLRAALAIPKLLNDGTMLLCQLLPSPRVPRSPPTPVPPQSPGAFGSRIRLMANKSSIPVVPLERVPAAIASKEIYCFCLSESGMASSGPGGQRGCLGPCVIHNHPQYLCYQQSPAAARFCLC